MDEHSSADDSEASAGRVSPHDMRRVDVDEALAHLAAIIESSDDAIVSKSLDGTIRSWNRGAERLFGYSAEEAIGQSITLIIPPELRHEEEEILRKVRRGERVDHFETTRISKSGQRIPISLTVSPVRDASGTVVGASKVARDISERKTFDRVVQEDARLLQILHRVSASLVSSQLDLSRVVRVATDAATEVSGAAFGAFFYNVEDQQGERYMLYTLSGAPREAFAQFSTPRKTAVFAPTFAGTSVVRSADITADPRYGRNAPHAGMPEGHLAVRSYLAVPVVSGSGEVHGGLFFGHPDVGVFDERDERVVVAIAAQTAVAIDNANLYVAAQREIESRKKAEQASEQTAVRFRDLANHIEIFAWTCDELGQATWYNDRWYEYTGTTWEDMRGDGWLRVQHPDHVDRVLAGIKRSLETGARWEDTFPIRSRSGEYRWFLSRAVPICDEHGRIVRWLGTNTDVTELRSLQEALLEADRRKDVFLATLAHELRNPLAPIRYALAASKQEGQTPAEKARATGIIERQIAHMSRLLDDLLEVSRITRGTLSLRKTRVDLASAISAAVEAVRPALEKKHQELSLQLPRESIPLDADLVRLAQVFTNLLVNASKYTQSGGNIELRARREGPHVVVSIIDDGIGISPESIPELFELFSRGESAVERSNEGLGIGLALVRGLVGLHDGSVEARSEGIGRGSEFVVRLPVAESVPERAPLAPLQEDVSDDGTRPLKIVVADDNVDTAESCAMLLRLHGHTVETANTGRAALELAARFRPDAMLLDIGMPEANGYEVARDVRSAPWGRDVLLVALTGWGQRKDRERSLASGFDRHLTKPVDVSTLERVLRSVKPGPSPTATRRDA